ncbi:MAG: mandelate racemase/muconate lactonizing enzyme family protein [Candidatus Poribacteria bacterium]|nr:mandelate racemase/muconate lactonizing enzyme family protein [Candidatus Poribacteria bacterium]
MTTLEVLSDSEKNRVRITGVKAMQLQNQAGQSLVKVETDAGIDGIGEAGASGPMARAHLSHLEHLLIGQDALEIDKLYTRMVNQQHTYRANIPTVSGVDIALWDLAGKILNRPVSTLLSGRFRDEIPLYINTPGPDDWFDAASCRDWAQRMKEAPQGWKTLKFGFERLMGNGLPEGRYATGQMSQTLTATEMDVIQRGYENCREALGFETDFIVHCHNEWDLPTATGLAQAVASSKPLWLEDALPVWYSDSWKALKQASPVRIITGEKLELPREFLPFLMNQALDLIHPDLVFAGGLTGCRKIADLAELFYIPVATHNVGSLVQNMATAHFGASVRNFVVTETRISQNPLIDEMAEEKVQVVDGKLVVPDNPGLGFTLIPEVLRENLMAGEPYWD